MRKTICYCDFCKRETADADLHVLDVGDKRDYEICKGCRIGIINRVIRDKTFVLTPWCKVCQGAGTIKESIGSDYDHTQYETKKCENCKI